MKKPHLSVQYKKDLGCVLPNKFDIISKVGNYDDVKVINTIKFQEGSVEEFGINGVTEESLLSVLMIRFEELQKSPLSCEKYQLSLELVNTLLQLLTKTDENYLVQNNISKTILNLLLEKRKEIKEEILTRKITPKQRLLNLIDDAIKLNKKLISICYSYKEDSSSIKSNNNTKYIVNHTTRVYDMIEFILTSFNDELKNKINFNEKIISFCYSEPQYSKHIEELLLSNLYKVDKIPKNCLLSCMNEVFNNGFKNKCFDYLKRDEKGLIHHIRIMGEKVYLRELEYITLCYDDELNNIFFKDIMIFGFYSNQYSNFNDVIEIMKKSRFY